MAPETQPIDLSVLAQKYALSSAIILGLGSGLYFEYFRSPHRSPTRFISGLHRDLEKTLAGRVSDYQADPLKALRDALRENALWFNLDRVPTTGLLGMEMLAEELPHFDTLDDRKSCVKQMATAILETSCLYRQTYADFLAECSQHLPGTEKLARGLNEIALEWHEFAEQLAETANKPSYLERSGRLLRRLSSREEHFWGSVLEM